MVRRGLIRAVAGPALLAARRPRAVLALFAAAALALGWGAARLELRSDLFDWLPARDPDVRAFERTLRELDGVADQEVVWLELADGAPGRVTDPAALSAQADLAAFVRARVPEVTAVIGAPTWLALADRAAGGDAASAAEVAALPALRTRLLWGGLERVLAEPLAATLASDRRAALLGFVLPGDPRDPAARAAGLAVADATRAWFGSSPAAQRFRPLGATPVGVASGLAALDARVRRDVRRLAPFSALAVALLLAAALRSARGGMAILGVAAFGALAPLGALGWSGRPLDVVTLLVVPLLLGVGIDAPLHWWGALGAARGRTLAARVRRAAVATGPALGAATATSAGAFLALGASGVPGLVELGALAALGVIALLLATLLGVTAAAALGSGAPPPLPGAGFGAAGRALTRRRGWLAFGAALLLTGAALLAPNQRAESDPLRGNFPADAPRAVAAERIRARLGAAFPEFVIVEGPLARALPYSERALDALRADPAVGDAARSLGPAQLVGGWQALQLGLAAAAPRVLTAGGDPAALLPADPAALERAVAALLDDPLWAQPGRALLAPASDPPLVVALLLPAPDASGGGIADAAALDRALRGVERAAPPPPGVEVSTLGYRTLAARFFAASVRALLVGALLGALLGAACAAAAAPRGSRRRAATATGLALAASALLLAGALPAAGVPLTLFALLPLALALGVGADHALHLLLAPGARRWSDAGARVAFAALSTALAFAPFALPWVGADVPSLRDTARAALLAVSVSWLAAVGAAALTPEAAREARGARGHG